MWVVVGEPHPGDRAIAHDDLVDVLAEADGAALILDDPRHRRGDRADAAHGVVHAEGAFEVRDQDVDRGDVERVAADEERVERQRHAQPRVAHAARDVGVDRAVGAQAREGRQHPDEVGEPVHRPAAEVLEAEAVAHGAFGEEPVVAGEIAGREAGDLGAHGVGVGAGAEGRAVGEADLVEGVERAEVDVVVEAAAAGGPELVGRAAAR